MGVVGRRRIGGTGAPLCNIRARPRKGKLGSPAKCAAAAAGRPRTIWSVPFRRAGPRGRAWPARIGSAGTVDLTLREITGGLRRSPGTPLRDSGEKIAGIHTGRALQSARDPAGSDSGDPDPRRVSVVCRYKLCTICDHETRDRELE